MTYYLRIILTKGIPIFLIEFIVSMLFGEGLHKSIRGGIIIGCALVIMKIIEDKKKKI